MPYHAHFILCFDFWSKNKNKNIDDDNNNNNNNNNNNRQGSFVVVESRIKHLKDDFGFIQEIKLFQKIIFALFIVFPSGIYLFKVGNRHTRTMCEICSKLTVKTPELRHWPRAVVLIVHFEQIEHIVLVFLLLTLNKYMPGGLIVTQCP